MKPFHLIGAIIFASILTGVSLHADSTVVTLLYDAGLHGKYGPCG